MLTDITYLNVYWSGLTRRSWFLAGNSFSFTRVIQWVRLYLFMTLPPQSLGIHSIQAEGETGRLCKGGRPDMGGAPSLLSTFRWTELSLVTIPTKPSRKCSPAVPRNRGEWLTVYAISTFLGTWDITVNMAEPLQSWPHTLVEERNELIDFCRASYSCHRRSSGCFERQKERPHSVLGCHWSWIVQDR